MFAYVGSIQNLKDLKAAPRPSNCTEHARPRVCSREHPLLKHPHRCGEKESRTAAPSLETRIPKANPRCEIRGGAASAAAATQAGSLLPSGHSLVGGSNASPPPASPPAHHRVVLFRVLLIDLCFKKRPRDRNPGDQRVVNSGVRRSEVHAYFKVECLNFPLKRSQAGTHKVNTANPFFQIWNAFRSRPSKFSIACSPWSH